MVQQQISAIEAIVGASSNTPGHGLHMTPLMYFENPVTSFSTLSSSYVPNTVAQFIKMILDGHHRGDTSSSTKRPSGTVLERGGFSYSNHIDQLYGTTNQQAFTVCCNCKGYLGHDSKTVFQALECFSSIHFTKTSPRMQSGNNGCDILF